MIPICWKCDNAWTIWNQDGILEFVGCFENDNINNYDDAKELCPLLAEED